MFLPLLDTIETTLIHRNAGIPCPVRVFPKNTCQNGCRKKITSVVEL